MLTKYTNESQRIATLMVWARHDGVHKGNGYSYRIQNLHHVDTANSVLVEDYEKNKISVLIDNAIIVTITLQNSIILRKEPAPRSEKAVNL